MANRGGARTVYSTAAGRICPGCGWPARDCKCSGGGADEPVPARVVAKLRVERAGRSGKTVSVVFGLPRNTAFLKSLCKDLKRACGTGGSIAEGTIELQGDLGDRIRECLLAKGIVLKG